VTQIAGFGDVKIFGINHIAIKPWRCSKAGLAVPSDPVGAGCLRGNLPSWLTGVFGARGRGVKVDHIRVIRDRPPPERSEIVPRLLIATFHVNPFPSLIAVGSAALLFPALFSFRIRFHVGTQGPGLPAGGEIHDLVGL